MDVDVRQLGQDVFGEDKAEREIEHLQTALNEALMRGDQITAGAVSDSLADRLPVWNGWPAELFDLREDYTAGLLDEIAAFIRRYVVLHDNQEAILAVWVLHTYVFQFSFFTPYIFVTAAEKACGKSLLMDVLRVLAHNPRRAGGITAAALVRVIDRERAADAKDRPTLFLDEMDAQLASNPEFAATLQGILNEGFVRYGVVTKCDGKNNELRDFAVYCPKVFAGIGNHLHDTTASRSIRIEMRRRTAGERVRSFDTEQAEAEALPLREMIERWSKTVTPVLRAAFRYGQVSGFDGRQNDTARPLLTIASLAGEAWHNRVLRAIRLAFASNAEATESFGAMLLSDIRAHFDERRTDRLTTADVLEYLHQLDERPWIAWGFRHEPMRSHQLAKELRKYRIAPRTLRIGSGTAKGYLRTDFEDAWARFCASVVADPVTAVTSSHTASVLAETLLLPDPEHGTPVTSEEEWLRL
ncbi:DUF3631 domain-containing protein [Occallatibacter riparius]|uniref:DUF3631 domain-containing protein n=1 Tax=Occallatibacter riparius TaxID=1002689 RepID=A0A9J7BFP8_9BACT|nr:DUF3631 domain-containing protein [Occallatibacter riparius]UWZ81836.1 DUF3631 domain-containing protein [Occallatibacter riparius]